MVDSTIAAALISAIASVLVALIGRMRRPAQTPAPGEPAPSPEYEIPNRHRAIWLAAVCVLVAWMVFAALFLHWDTAALTVFAIPPAVWILAAAFPIQPSGAAAVALFLFPFAFAAEPIGKWRRGIHFENHFEPGVVAAFLGIGFGTALIAWLIARKRLKSLPAASRGDRPHVISSALAKGLADLAELHRRGVLSDEEYARAKNKLLSD